MKKSLLLLVPFAMFTVAACQSLEPASPEQASVSGKKIEFSSSVGDYTKATDTSFENGDVAGLTAGEPVNASNVKLTYKDGGFTAEQPLYWGLDQKNDQKTSFVAYIPYDASVDPTKPFTFNIKEDQSAAGAYAASDLLTAQADACPADPAVHLAFSHVLSRLVLSLKNEVVDDEIVGVKLAGVQLTVSADILKGTYTASGSAATVTPAKTGENYVFLVAPQKAAAEVLISMKSGKTVRYTPEAELAFVSGKQISAAITVASDAVNFEAEIVDWLDTTASFGKEYDDGSTYEDWLIRGNFEGSNGKISLPMALQEDGSYYIRISNLDLDSDYLEFYLVNSENELSVGQAAEKINRVPEGETIQIPVSYSRDYFVFYGKDIYDLNFYPGKGLLAVRRAPHEWESLGTGKFIDGFVTDLFGGIPHEEFEVEVEVDALRSGVYRLPNAYKNWSLAEAFNYTEGGELILNAHNANRTYFQESFTGLSYGKYGDIVAFSLVPENDWTNYSYYSWFYEDYQYYPFNDVTATWLVGADAIYFSNQQGLMALTLPGGTRPYIHTDVNFYLEGTEVGEGGTNYAVFTVTPEMDVTELSYGIWAGSLAREDIIATCVPQVQNKEEGTVVITDFTADAANTVKIPFTQSGTYTVLFYASNGDSWNWRFSHVGMLIEGEEAPKASMSITVPEDQGAFGDAQLTFHIDMKDPATLAYAVLRADDFANSGLTEDNIYDYVLSNGIYANLYYFNDTKGADYVVSGLEANTAYVILAAGETQFGNSTWALAYASTKDSPSFSYLGTGRYSDFTFIAGGNYQSNVEIMKMENAERYLVLSPYEAWWNAGEYEEGTYYGYSASSIDFAVVDGEVIYKDFYTGYYEPGYAPVVYQYRAGYNNKVITDGVYNFSPYARLEGTNYYYNFLNLWEYIYVELPGVDYTPSWMSANNAPAKMSAQKPSPLASNVPERAKVQKVQPFKHHMVKTGKPVVLSARDTALSLSNNVETIKK